MLLIGTTIFGAGACRKPAETAAAPAVAAIPVAAPAPPPPPPTRIERADCRIGADPCTDPVTLARGAPVELVLKPSLESPRVAVLDKDLKPVPALGSIRAEGGATHVTLEPRELSPGAKYTIEVTADGLEPLELQAAAGSGWEKPKPARKARRAPR
jgi:hypothetical protein